MRAVARLAAAAFFCAAAMTSAAHAAAVSGIVRNGTSGRPASGVDVILIRLQGEMETVASTKTDAQGTYTLDHAAAGQEAMLVRAVYRGVSFHQALPPGRNTADVTVYEPSTDPKTISVNSRVLVFQPNGATLLVAEEYGLENASQPPVAYYNNQGNFEFELPEGVSLSQVSTWGPSRMPVVQGTINRGDRKYAIAYAFQPGENGVRMAYQAPYQSNQATLRFPSTYSAENVLLVAPPSLTLESAGFTPSGQEQGFALYTRQSVPAGTPIEVSVSGTAPLPAQSGQASGSASAGAPGIQVLPNRLDGLKWMILGGFVALFSLGVIFLWRKPAVAVTTGPAIDTSPAPPPSAARASRKSAAPRVAEIPAVSDVNQQVEMSLEQLKDKLFKLELRKQAGTISDEDYASERSRAEKVLRDLVGG
jgi:hypothetical protein